MCLLFLTFKAVDSACFLEMDRSPSEVSACSDGRERGRFPLPQNCGKKRAAVRDTSRRSTALLSTSWKMIEF